MDTAISNAKPIRLIVVMGVSGCGKSTVGSGLARRLGWKFTDGDDLHSPQNVSRMESGLPLNDAMREPWLKAICRHSENRFQSNESLVLACSALKKSYRDILRTVSKPIRFLFLDGSPEIISKRLNAREGHYMPASLLNTQFADLESPAEEVDVISIDIENTISGLIEEAFSKVQDLVD